MTDQNKLTELFNIIDEIEIGMLVSENQGHLRSRPMKVFIDHSSDQLWFLTKLSSPKIIEIVKESELNVSFACPKTQRYVSVSGKGLLSRNREKIDWMWSDDMAVWFDCEKDDPNVAAICVVPTIAEYWQGESNQIKRMWEITKAKVTGDQPDLGDNETIRLAG